MNIYHCPHRVRVRTNARCGYLCLSQADFTTEIKLDIESAVVVVTETVLAEAVVAKGGAAEADVFEAVEDVAVSDISEFGEILPNFLFKWCEPRSLVSCF